MTRYIVCRTCGRYTDSLETAGKAWCSEECMRAYSSCVNCGKYFLRGTGFDEDHCSRACTVQYEIFRKYGPEPVTVIAELT